MGRLVQPPCQSRVIYSRLHRTLSRRVLNISREGPGWCYFSKYRKVLLPLLLLLLFSNFTSWVRKILISSFPWLLLGLYLPHSFPHTELCLCVSEPFAVISLFRELQNYLYLARDFELGKWTALLWFAFQAGHFLLLLFFFWQPSCWFCSWSSAVFIHVCACRLPLHLTVQFRLLESFFLVVASAEGTLLHRGKRLCHHLFDLEVAPSWAWGEQVEKLS